MLMLLGALFTLTPMGLFVKTKIQVHLLSRSRCLPLDVRVSKVLIRVHSICFGLALMHEVLVKTPNKT